MRNISDILEKKGTDVRCIEPSRPVVNAVCKMSGAGIGVVTSFGAKPCVLYQL